MFLGYCFFSFPPPWGIPPHPEFSAVCPVTTGYVFRDQLTWEQQQQTVANRRMVRINAIYTFTPKWANRQKGEKHPILDWIYISYYSYYCCCRRLFRNHATLDSAKGGMSIKHPLRIWNAFSAVYLGKWNRYGPKNEIQSDSKSPNLHALYIHPRWINTPINNTIIRKKAGMNKT